MLRLSLLLLSGLLLAPFSVRAASEPGCVSAKVERASGAGAVELYRIVFQNRCDRPRNLYWCAEADRGPLPPGLACARPQATSVGPIAESRHAIRLRKEFQWHLPAGTRIRFHDCPLGEMPTTDFGCAPPPAPVPARR